MGAPYGVVLYCATTIQLGDTWWSFDETGVRWPPPMPGPPFPFNIFQTVSDPYEVPGIVTLWDEDSATFRADSDASELALTGHDENPGTGSACL